MNNRELVTDGNHRYIAYKLTGITIDTIKSGCSFSDIRKWYMPIRKKKVDMAQDGFSQFNAIAVEILNEIISKVEKVELILSTSHRFRFPVLEWMEIFKRRMIFADRISILDIQPEERSNRKKEIVNWMDICQYNPEEVLIIDEDKSLNGLPQNLKERLLLTNPYTGLNNANYSDLYRILK